MSFKFYLLRGVWGEIEMTEKEEKKERLPHSIVSWRVNPQQRRLLLKIAERTGMSVSDIMDETYTKYLLEEYGWLLDEQST